MKENKRLISFSRGNVCNYFYAPFNMSTKVIHIFSVFDAVVNLPAGFTLIIICEAGHFGYADFSIDDCINYL